MSKIIAAQKIDLSKETTFRVGCFANEVYLPSSVEEFCELLISKPYAEILGAGSNVIVSSEKVDAPVILTRNLNAFNIEDNILTVQCGAKTAILAQKTLEAGLSGFEFLTCIPASIGGVVYMNASAHKQAISDVIISAKVFDIAEKKIIELSKEELELSYRTSVLQKKPYVLIEAVFELQKNSQIHIKERMEANKAYRAENHPSMKTPNAGSIFRNPEGAVAGRLIDDSCLKGASLGGAKVSEIHANFIVNEDRATSFEILSLMSFVQDEVQKKYGYKLKPEVKYIGNSEKEEKIWQKLNS